jgi:AraC-like DNA-binding protein
VEGTQSSHGNSVVLLRPLASVLRRLDVDADRFLAEVGVDDTTPPDAYVPNALVDRSLDAIAAARGDDTFGLTIAREAVARPPLGLFGNLVWLSGTLRDALARGARFYSLITRRATLSLDVAEGGGVAVLTQRMVPGAARGNILTDYLFASLVLRARAAAGERFHVRSMRFAHAAPSVAPYEELFRSRVTFDGERAGGIDALTLDASLLDLPLSSADPFTAAAVEAEVAQRIRAATSLPLVDNLRTAVSAELRAGRPSVASIARRLGVGGRALRRRLEDQRLSLRAIVASVQRDRASELLADGASIKQVAFELGFSEPSAFSRAYKRWTGRPPSGR